MMLASEKERKANIRKFLLKQRRKPHFELRLLEQETMQQRYGRNPSRHFKSG
jgi:hypothetical protein